MSLETPVSLTAQVNSQPDDDASSIYTHATKTRMIVLYLLLLYTTLMVLFLQTLKLRFESMQKVPDFFRHADSGLSEALFLIIAGVALVMALALFVFLLWAAFDIWGLEVEVSAEGLAVRNTILGRFLKSRTGVGFLKLEEISELKGGKYATQVVGTNRVLRFSPVQKVDKLIAYIIANAPNVRIQ